MLGAPPANAAYPLRSPQVPLQTGWDGISLQTYLNSVGETLNTLTQQLDLETWQATNLGAMFTLKVEIAGYADQNNIGIYNASESTPTTFQVFPGAASQGWYALCVFSGGGHLAVSLYDNSNALQGTTTYTGVDASNFGFYLQGPGGMFYSQDARNPGGHPQILTYAGTNQYTGMFWECFEDLPYASSDVDFQDAVLTLQSIAPTPTRGTTWGSLKSLYR
ncbi:MAG TPA: hypothetical protein VMI75_23005 [Polyangiaceae bacterium]|nr:hypothetical protein [Polyangiaceae bacterium]